MDGSLKFIIRNLLTRYQIDNSLPDCLVVSVHIKNSVVRMTGICHLSNGGSN